MAKVTRRGVLGAVAGVSGAALAPAVWAQSDWPNRPVRVVVPYAPGSGTDFIVRASEVAASLIKRANIRLE